jgi:hypothetical protein
MSQSAVAPWMKLGKLLLVFLAVCAIAGLSQHAVGALLDPSDAAFGIFTGPVALNGRYPGGENPPKAIDGVIAGSKYLNFGRHGSGFIVTPSLALPVESFQVTTANDAPGRDPGSWELYGFGDGDDLLITTDSGPSPLINQSGLAEPWVLIDSGLLALPGDPNVGNDQRGVVGPLVNVASGIGYQHYKMVFPTLKDQFAPGVDSMQYAEVQFFLDDLGASPYLSPLDPVIAVDGIMGAARYNRPEDPPKLLDSLSNTKFLSRPGPGSGVIVTNSSGPVDVNWMQLTTANDDATRDPTSYELYGTNDPILSQPLSNGLGGEVWTLISSGPLSLPAARQNSSTILEVPSLANYTSYKLVFPTTNGNAGLFQLADVQFYTVPEPSTLALVAMGLALVGTRRRRR